jgi:hypothetical protein
MIAVYVTFKFEGNFNEAAIRKIAEDSRAKFEGMPNLRYKIFTVRPERREATNFYLWSSEQAARTFFNDQLLERVTALYGVRPTVEFAQVAATVENLAS